MGRSAKELSQIVKREEKKKLLNMLLLLKLHKLNNTACRLQQASWQALQGKTKHEQEVLGKLAKPPGAARWTAKLE